MRCKRLRQATRKYASRVPSWKWLPAQWSASCSSGNPSPRPCSITPKRDSNPQKRRSRRSRQAGAVRTQSGLHVPTAPYASVVAEVSVVLDDMAIAGRAMMTS